MVKKKKVDKEQGATLPILILDAYAEYISNGYPKDPNVYVIRANKETKESIIRYLNKNSTYMTNRGGIQDFSQSIWGMRVEVDDKLSIGQIQISPEVIEIFWNGE